jgi:phosphatidyl-myo-inositol dimannoside synthase
VARRAAQILRAERCQAVWFGASAPLALLAPHLRRAGATRVVASTHGHEVGWSMLPGARQALHRIGAGVDVLTFVSRYTRSRFAAAFGPLAALEYLPPGVDTERFRPDPAGRALVRDRYHLGDRPTVVCVSRLVPRKGQDTLIDAMPTILSAVPDAVLLIVGGGPYEKSLRERAARLSVAPSVRFTGAVPWAELPAHHGAGDVFAMPCRTRRGGLDVEGLGIVYLEASATGLPVVAGDSGGAPDAVLDGETGWVVHDTEETASRIIRLLADPDLRRRMGERGRQWVEERWRWDLLADRLRELLQQHGTD